jgi:hypothetical protein
VESSLRSWGIVLRLSDRTVELASQLLQKTRGKKVFSISKQLLVLYIASIMTGEYTPLSLIAYRSSHNSYALNSIYVRHDAKRLFGIELDVDKIVEVEVRGLCRVLGLDPLLCEASVCTAVNTLHEIVQLRCVGYIWFTAMILRLTAKRLHITRLNLPKFLPHPQKNRRKTLWRRAEKYVDACIERARQSVQPTQTE